MIEPTPVVPSASEGRATGTVLAGRDGAGLRALPTPLLEGLRAKLGPTFVNEQQRRFMRSEAPEVLYSGAFRAGKSRIGCEKAYALMKRYPGIPIGIFRKAARDLESSTQYTFLHDVVPRDAIVASNRTFRWYELANGSRVTFFGLEADPITQQPSGVGSVELGWAFIDEAVECTENDWAFVQGRLSWPGIPFHQLAGATNPAQPTHWLKQRFTPPTKERVYLHASTLDNPMLPKDYVETQLRANVGFRLDRYVMGEWTAVEGQIWTLPDAQVREPDPGPWKQVVAGVDWGFVHAFACEVVGVSGSGRKAVIDEVYLRGVTIDKIIPALQIVRDQHGITTFYGDPSEPAYIAQCRAAGLPMEPARNDVGPGIAAVARAIADGMSIHPACTGLLGEIPGYTWKVNRDGGFLEKPIEINDDACVTADTLVRTKRGDVPITAVTTDDHVLTRRGWRSVVAYGQTGTRETVRVTFSDGRSLQCTPDHRIWTQRGWVQADALRYNDVVCTRPPLATRLGASGWPRTVRSLAARTFTTATETSRTMTLATWSASRRANTLIATSHAATIGPWLGSSTSTASDRWQPTGTAPRLAVSGTASMRSSRVSDSVSGTSAPAIGAATSTSPTRRTRGSAPTPASPQGAERPGSTTRIGRAFAAAWRSVSIATRASVTVRAVAPASRVEVYNLAVEGQPEYFANGVLTHNCDALRYGIIALDPAMSDNPWAQLVGKRAGAVA